MKPKFQCRICSSKQKFSIYNLGNIALTGRFLNKHEKINSYHLELVACNDCDLVQLNNTCEAEELYGDFYGYSSSLNQSMVKHLESIYLSLKPYINNKSRILDIGSNDGTFLNFFVDQNLTVGIDPSAKKFKKLYKKSKLIPNFFNSQTAYDLRNKIGNFDLITSIAMFYDLEDPVQFARDVESLLTSNGIWVLEQSYLPLMIRNNAFDTICHEHIEYYKIKDIINILERVGMKVFNVFINDVNGGSFRLMCCKKDAKHIVNHNVHNLLEEEIKFFSDKNIYNEFNKRVISIKNELRDLLQGLKEKNINVYGLGASTKGNVLLQHFEIDHNLIKAIGEVNPEKFGKYTPGSDIPIIDQDQILSDENAYFLILPWHFKDFFINSNRFKKCNLIFPLPEVQVFKNG